MLSKIISEESSNITNNDFYFTQSVAGFTMLLRDSKYAKALSYSKIISYAKDAKGKDTQGNRAEFIKMTEKAELLKMVQR